MLKKTMTYDDYNGVSRTEDFYFNLTKAEILEMQMSTDGGFDGMVKRAIDAQDQKELIKVFKEMILKAYGEKSADGKRFRKSEEISKDFESTEAYAMLFMELATNAEAAAAFVNAIVPTEDRPSIPAPPRN